MDKSSLDAGTMAGRSDVLEVKNVGRTEIGAYAPVDLLETYLRDGRVVAKVEPSTTFGFNDRVFLNGETPIPPDGFGAVQMGDFIIGRVNADDGVPEIGQHWGPATSDAKLRKYVPGARVLRVFALNEQVLLQRSADVIMICRLNGQLNQGESVTATLMRFDDENSEQVAVDGVTLTVLERTGMLTQDINTLCFVKWLDQFAGWVVIGFVC